MSKTYTLEEFLVEMPAFLEAFADAYKRNAEEDPTFDTPRTLDDWCREMEAYELICESEES